LAGVALAAVILSEPVRPTFLQGGALILVGVWVGAFSAQSDSAPASAVIDAEPGPDLAPVVDDAVVVRAGPSAGSQAQEPAL
jgi:hypothetical protein